jgi:arylsulfatase A-like enzyme
LQVIFNPGWFAGDGIGRGTGHGTLYAFDTHIPLLFMGWGIRQGNSNTEVHITDIAPTISALLHIQMPSGCIGQVISSVLLR